MVEYLELLDDGGIDAFVGHADRVPPRFLSTSLLQDPLVRLVMQSDGVTEQAMIAVLEQLRRSLAARAKDSTAK